MTPRTRKLLNRIVSQKGLQDLSAQDLDYLSRECGHTPDPTATEKTPQSLLHLIIEPLLRNFPQTKSLLSTRKDLDLILSSAAVQAGSIGTKWASFAIPLDPDKLYEIVKQNTLRDCGDCFNRQGAVGLAGFLGQSDLIRPLLDLAHGVTGIDRTLLLTEVAFSLTLLNCQELDTLIPKWLNDASLNREWLQIFLLLAHLQPDLFSDQEVAKICAPILDISLDRIPYSVAVRAIRGGYRIQTAELRGLPNRTIARLAIHSGVPDAAFMKRCNHSPVAALALALECMHSNDISLLQKDLQPDDAATHPILEFARHVVEGTDCDALRPELNAAQPLQYFVPAVFAGIIQAKDKRKWIAEVLEAPGYLMNGSLHLIESLDKLLAGEPEASVIRSFLDGFSATEVNEFLLNASAYFIVLDKIEWDPPEPLRGLRRLLFATSHEEWMEAMRSHPLHPVLACRPNFLSELVRLIDPSDDAPFFAFGCWVHTAPAEFSASIPEQILFKRWESLEEASILTLFHLALGGEPDPLLTDFLRTASSERPQEMLLNQSLELPMLFAPLEQSQITDSSLLLFGQQVNRYPRSFTLLLMGATESSCESRESLVQLLKGTDQPCSEDPFLHDLFAVVHHTATQLSELNDPHRLLFCPAPVVRDVFCRWLINIKTSDESAPMVNTLLNTLAQDPDSATAKRALAVLMRSNSDHEWIWRETLKAFESRSWSEDSLNQMFEILLQNPNVPLANAIVRELRNNTWNLNVEQLTTQLYSVAQNLPSGILVLCADQLDNIQKQFGGKIDLAQRLRLASEDNGHEYLVSIINKQADANLAQEHAGKVLVIRPLPDNPAGPPNPVQAEEFWALAAHLEVTYTDEESHALICRVSPESSTCEVISALLEPSPFTIFSAEWT